MEQIELREWENKCIQEEVPQCTASCPLHVDVRTFCQLMGQGKWSKAWAVLAKTLPLPSVLARLCDARCKSACIREKVDGSIEIGLLERFCAENSTPTGPPRPLPARGKTVAVFGGGITGLCATWELARRGFNVTLHCSVPGEKLLDLSEDLLPRAALDHELRNLVKLGVTIKADVKINTTLLNSALEKNNSVFIDSDSLSKAIPDFGEPDEITLGTQRTGLFISRTGETSFVLQAAAGRRAANSIERFTQGVSMVAGRDREGPYKTRLFTNLKNVKPIPPLANDGSHTEKNIRDEAKRCIQCECMECVKNCEYLKHYKGYPKIYARQIYNNESIVMGTRQANTMINSCMLCGLCETLCPEDFSMAEVCLEARQRMVIQNKMPPSAHEFAIRDMEFANGEKSALAHHAPDSDSSEYLFFPGCQLSASSPDGVEAAYHDLRKRIGNVGLMLRCCGAPAKWAGRETLMKETITQLKKQWKALGSPKIIAACPTCIKILRQEIPDAEILSHWSILRTLGLPDTAALTGGTLAINDPCAARHDPTLLEDVRALLELLQTTITEPELTGKNTECCGYGGLLSEANPNLAKTVAKHRAEAAKEDFVTYCAMCRDMLAKTGKRTMHLYDLLFPRQNDPGSRPSPGYSARRENRVHLKERMVRELWQEETISNPKPYESIKVSFTEEATKTMEERRILKTDIQKVLLQAKKSGKWFIHHESGHFLASLRPTVVTYWVEFEEHDHGYLIHNTWSHRMHIKENKL